MDRRPTNEHTRDFQEQIGGIKSGDIIDFLGKKMRVVGFTGSKDNNTRAFMVEELKPEELEAFKQREQIILGKIKQQIESNPNTVVDIEQARKYWGRLYDMAGNGQRMEMELNEVYAQKYEATAALAQERIMALEKQLNLVKSEGEKQAILSKIEEEVKFAMEMRQEAEHRRS